MARRTEEQTVEISGRPVRVLVQQYDSLEALDLFATLLDVFAPAASTIIVGLSRGGDDSVMGVASALDGEEVATALRSTVGRLPNRAARDALIFQIFRGTRCVVGEAAHEPTSKERVSLVFEADLMALFRVMAFALQVQYGDFWGAAFAAYSAQLAESAAAKARAAAQAPARVASM